MKLLMMVSAAAFITAPIDMRRSVRSAVASDPNKGGFGGLCENVWDCEAPLECCDLVMLKMCCGDGRPAFMQPQLQPIPVPVDPSLR